MTTEPLVPLFRWYGRARGPAFVAAVIAALLVGFSNDLAAHKHPCGHHHATNSVVTCNNTSACTQDGNSGNCKSEQGRARTWCRCTADGGGDDTEPGRGCNASVTWFFNDQDAGLPAANTPIIYLADGHEDNFISISMLGGVFGPEFDAKSNAVEGTISLFYGSFADPENVPVVVEDVSISLIEIAGEGSNWFELPNGEFQDLVYNSLTGEIDTVDEHGITLWMSNDLAAQLPVKLNLSATVEAGGDLHGFAQIAAPIIVFIDGVESGDSDEWTLSLE